jgi:hypothetical protein
MTLNPGCAVVRPKPLIAGRATNGEAAAEVATAAQTAADILGFPRTAGPAQATGAPMLTTPMPLTPLASAALQGDGGFESLPVALVAQIVAPYLGIPGLTAMRGLATQYPGFRDAIGAAVNADPAFHAVGMLVQPMRNIVLRDRMLALIDALRRALPASNDGATLSPSERENLQRLVDMCNSLRGKLPPQLALVHAELRSTAWLPLAEQLVLHQVAGAQPEHAVLLKICDRILAGEIPTDLERDEAVRSADVIGFAVTQCRHLINSAQTRHSDDDDYGLEPAIASYRNSVLGDAFEKIADAFGTEAGWTLEGLLAESALVGAHGLS